MNQIYDKDDCAPDARSAQTWLDDNNIDYRQDMFFEHSKDDGSTRIIKTNDNRYLSIEKSCGLYETIFELSQAEAQAIVNKQIELLFTKE